MESLPEDMESLEILNQDSCRRIRKRSFSTNTVQRITRSLKLGLLKETSILEHDPVCLPTPTKRRNPNPEEEIKKFYLNKKIKILHKNLETIYEDPVQKKGQHKPVLLGTAKVKRSIYLNREFRITNKQKTKLRNIKLKRLGKRKKKVKMSDEEFKQKMLLVDQFINDDDDEKHMEVDKSETSA